MACQPEPNSIDLVQNMLVQTNYESTANFSSYSTYALALDTLGFFYGDAPTDTILLGTYAEKITAQIKFNMDKAGYTSVPNYSNPDLAINAFVLRDFGVIQSLSYPGYYGSYSGYYNPKYYGFKNYYGYPYLNIYNYNTATLVIEIIDMKNKDGQGKLGDLGKTMQQMEENEKDIVNKRINDATLKRQEDKMTRLLESEKAERERDQEERRESNEAKTDVYRSPARFEEYKRLKMRELELLKTIPPSLTTFYKNLVNSYFQSLDN